MTTWITDDRGNKCSVEYFGSKEAAQTALDSLRGCDNCINCSRCSDCSDCSGCSDCSHCSDCSDCSGCSGCSGCSDCSHCSGCSHCSDCSDCSHCSGCSGCSDCSHCSGCSDCSHCSGCSDCSHCYSLKNASPAEAGSAPWAGPPSIPTIENIHAKVYKAATARPTALDMSTWHSCKTTHCRAGWVVHLAGEPGYELERFHGTALAAQLIYRESDPANPVAPTRFYETNEVALADMKRLAGAE